MDSAIDYAIKQKNKAYYDHLSSSDRMVFKSLPKKQERVVKRESKSFASKEVDFSNFVLVPSGYEHIAYIIYFTFIPYLVGNIFLFLFISNGDFSNYKLLDTSAFLIVWIIGYEIVATLALTWIMALYLRYDVDEF